MGSIARLIRESSRLSIAILGFVDPIEGVFGKYVLTGVVVVVVEDVMGGAELIAPSPSIFAVL